ncbi:cob(I)yrinic acid a,c-diamide adenosyltransferase [Terricaulis silvestris]|uniref:Corrinoid adenosyltransferase n=1 Tax=Terricaulis silvestris TaxID=2686094 RepID=A0A6I6MMA1_9CAUL|nr:cob(I)yrinic acid a,c-diamide adenosyltransferase [Terricaulis silvestris]QGZ94376.1 Cob(I)yrinic acid a,c-diamide adenosyltransferase [Terricaulis silvestris]
MVRLDKIVTKAGDGGKTRLATGEPVSKASARVEAYGAVDEANSAIGVARLHTTSDPVLDPILDRLQNDLFDLGADLATPDSPDLKFEPLRIQSSQTDRLETEVDALNEKLSPLTSFILPGGSPAAAHLHLARAIARRAERAIVALADVEAISPEAVKFANRLSDLLFVAARYANDQGRADLLWKPGANR